jgi:hypothetical protein
MHVMIDMEGGMFGRRDDDETPDVREETPRQHARHPFVVVSLKWVTEATGGLFL